ncbi:MAG: hypothetical protein J1F04_09575 [Oscillospiraceae bacterium]|nr:hypothetical protein [Oscillospiraceae bacterium]
MENLNKKQDEARTAWLVDKLKAAEEERDKAAQQLTITQLENLRLNKMLLAICNILDGSTDLSE